MAHHPAFGFIRTAPSAPPVRPAHAVPTLPGQTGCVTSPLLPTGR